MSTSVADRNRAENSLGFEEIIRKLEQFPAEVLEAALLVLQMRATKRLS